jgi:transcription elongation factor GreB
VLWGQLLGPWQTSRVSRAFVKEDAETAPLVPRRAPLPEGARNYVTRRGLALLRAEQDELLAQLSAEERASPSVLPSSATLRARILELEGRLASAELVDPPPGELEVVRFGLSVTVRSADGTERSVRIVGVDEANAAEGRIAFVAPVARALLGKRAGETTLVKTPRGEEELEIVEIAP